MSLLHRPDDYNGFTPSSPPQILQQNCAHACDTPKEAQGPTINKTKLMLPLAHQNRMVYMYVMFADCFV